MEAVLLTILLRMLTVGIVRIIDQDIWWLKVWNPIQLYGQKHFLFEDIWLKCLFLVCITEGIYVYGKLRIVSTVLHYHELLKKPMFLLTDDLYLGDSIEISQLSKLSILQLVSFYIVELAHLRFESIAQINIHVHINFFNPRVGAP